MPMRKDPNAIEIVKMSAVRSKKDAIGRILSLANKICRKDIDYNLLASYPTKWSLVTYHNTLVKSYYNRKENR